LKDDLLYLVHIKECIERVKRYTEDGREAFYADTKTQDAVLRNLQILAESSQRLSDSLKDMHSEVDWRGISAFRNVPVHGYLSIDVVQTTNIVKQDLSPLEERIDVILREQKL
jgi:uncharacterized protein with HEPN domain